MYENLWRFYDGSVGGVVIADHETEAKERATAYLEEQFDDFPTLIGNELKVWRVIEDDDYNQAFPFAIAVNY